MTAPTPVDRLRQAIADTLSIDAQGLQAAIGQLVVATSADYPVAGPEDRSLYSAAVHTTVLLADRIPEGQEAQALAQEIERHHGRQAAQAVLGELSLEDSDESQIDLDDVAEWVGLHYGRNFERESLEKRDEWVGRYAEAHGIQQSTLSSAVSNDYGSLESAKKFCANNGLKYDVHETKPRALISKPADGRLVERNVTNDTHRQSPEGLEQAMTANYIDLEVTLRSKTTFGTDKETIRVWDGQSAKDVAERSAQAYGAEVVEIRNPDGSIYEEPVKVEDSPSPGM